MQRGFLRKRGTTWTAYYYVHVADTRRQRSKGGFRTKAEGQAFLNTQLAALQTGELVDPSRLTLGAYLLERWLPMVQLRIRHATYDSYLRLVTNHVLPTLGHVPLQELRADHLDRLYASLLIDGGHRLPGRGLSPKTVRNVHGTLCTALRDAERKRFVTRNVALAADPPRVRLHGSREMHTWTAEELRTFLEAMQGHRLYAAYLLAAMTGMRRGEVLGLRWQDVDLNQRWLAVRQTLTAVNYVISFGPPKTTRGRRLIALDPGTAAALAAHRRRQLVEQSSVGLSAAELVFVREDGDPIHPDYFSQTFDRTVKRLKLPRIRLHDLRHTHATLGLAAGIQPKVMSDRLGHATVAFTQDIYVHAIPQLQESAAGQISDLIWHDETAATDGLDARKVVNSTATGRVDRSLHDPHN